MADVAFTESTGKPIDRTMLAWVGLDGASQPAAVARAAPARPGTATAAARSAPAAVAMRGAPTRIFPAATTRIVPLADYARLPGTPPRRLPAAGGAAAAGAVPRRTMSAAPAQAEPTAAASELPAVPGASGEDLQGAQALLAALRDSGVDPASAARAAAAYQASLGLPLAAAPRDDTTHSD